jgi:hypothetical protein
MPCSVTALVPRRARRRCCAGSAPLRPASTRRGGSLARWHLGRRTANIDQLCTLKMQLSGVSTSMELHLAGYYHACIQSLLTTKRRPTV